MASPRPPTHEKISNGARQGATPTSKMVPMDKKEEPHLMVLPPPTATTTMAPTRSSSPKMKTMESTLQDEGRSTQLYANMTMICPPRPRSSQCFRCTQDGHHLWECPNLHCDVCTSNKHMTWECNTPQAHKLYFAQLDAQFANMTLQDTIVFKEWCKEMDKMTTMKPTLQDGAREGQDKSDVDSSLALNNTIAPSKGVNMGGDGVEKVEHGMIPSTKEANGVENGEHGMIPSPMEAHGDDKIEPTPICLNDEMVPIPCEHESHLTHLSESDSELSDSHPICEIECFHLEDMSDTPSTMDDEFPIMEKMYMVHEDDAITPCLIEDEHGGHMEPTTSTTPTSNESDYKGTRKTRSTSIEHELTKRALESIIQGIRLSSGHSSVVVIYLLYKFMKSYRRGRLFFKWGEMIRVTFGLHRIMCFIAKTARQGTRRQVRREERMPWRPEDARPMSRKHGREGERGAGRSRRNFRPRNFRDAGTSAQVPP
ncbi:hypothetical protein QYE76_023056 [Lolium multiflorum]|uniref:CCHC-type domain-containing protein n=1 Tax=Lolium multiflorum TaxID=4521 RepID=A0AAD8VSF6_LOLMU|nr:hypothetical protein QYE76_023056 [Lolium multiflorum]